jgi:thiol-disulfide isomerase/thioredoxin
VGGGTVDLAALRGRPVWVNFMRTDCPPCRDEFPVMSGFATRYASTNLVVVAVDIRESETTADDFARSLGATFPVGLDADGSVQSAWGALVLPVHFWVDAGGVIREGALGGIGPDLMAHGLSTILPGVNVTP